jgi:hypothetical protein
VPGRAGAAGYAKAGPALVQLTLQDDTRPAGAAHDGGASPGDDLLSTPRHRGPGRAAYARASYGAGLDYFADVRPFEHRLRVDPAALASADHPDVKLRNLPGSLVGGGPAAPGGGAAPSAAPPVVGGVHDLIGLTHLHEPAILHALRLRYDADVIYTSTGPILIAINPFQV